MAPSTTILQGIYAKHFGFTLSTLAWILLAARLFDAVADPVIGYFSDHYYSRVGSRKPFVVCGGVLIIISSYFLYVPPDNVSTAYFLGWFLAFYFAYTLYQVPHITWGGELCTNADEKNEVYSWRTLAVNLGTLLFFAIPLLPFFETSEFTPEILKWTVLIACPFILLFLYFSIKTVPNRHLCNGAHSKRRIEFSGLGREILSNKPLLLYLLSYSFFGVGIGMWATLLFILVDSYLGIGDQFSIAFVFGLIASTISIAFWWKLATHRGKLATWCFGSCLGILGVLGTAFLNPSDSHSIYLLLVVIALTNCATAATEVLAPSLLSDISDYATWKFDTERSATYFSLYILIAKANVAIGGAIGFAIAGWYGFDPAMSHHSGDAIFGLHLAMVWLPLPLLVAAAALIAFIPINSRRHHIIRCRLDLLEARKTSNLKKYANLLEGDKTPISNAL